MKQLIIEWSSDAPTYGHTLKDELKSLISSGHKIHSVVVTESYSYSGAIRPTKAIVICEKLVTVTT